MFASDPVQGPAPLMDTTLDQLRSLIAVRDTGSALRAARLLDRDQSSVQKQIDTLNRNLGALCGEPLVLKQGRGRDVVFTGTGEALVEAARDTLENWRDRIRMCRDRAGALVVVGTTRFTLGALTSVGAVVADEFRRRDVELRIEHVRSKDVLPKLRSKEVDLVCGSIALPEGHGAPADCEVREFSRTGPSVLTNLSTRLLPGPEVKVSALRELPLVVPDHGLIADCLRGWFGGDHRRQLNIAAQIDAVTYGLELLCSALPVRGCMLVTHGIGEMVRDGRMATGGGLRVLPVVNDTPVRMQILTGAFRRRDDAARDGSHPLSMLWAALAR
ncbi:LysR family transcriptional regulator [Embleya hyalina]|uniref:LysR family transcriptional regulator n=2 Tax=Embleya hyalina TaxID=516124 RepID=A0A401YQE4_9ACTN|nr:LysR family transcriptional regulator [Embleya hyalina]